MIFRRNYNCKFVWKNIVDNKIIYCPDIPKNIMHSGYRCYIFAKNRNIRNEIIEYLNKKGIDANQGSCPEIYREIRFKNKQKYKILHNAKKLGNLSISLPSHNFIEKRRLQYMVDTINTYIKINDKL
jgi:dTDP-4-amino-4,6-dideoxygalactose transaminase